MIAIMKELIKDGNSIVLVDHDTRILKEADYMIEIGPEAGKNGGSIISQGTIDEIIQDNHSIIGPYLNDLHQTLVRNKKEIFTEGFLRLKTDTIHTVKPLDISIPRGALTTITGMSGSGKTTLILESLYPAIKASLNHEALPQIGRASCRERV